MAGVIMKFLVASMLMWVVPIAILYGFNHNLFPGFFKPTKHSQFSSAIVSEFRYGITDLSSSSLTLLSGFLAVISVNVVIAIYICLAMREPMEKHEPDPRFLSEAKASISQFKPNETEESSSNPKKEH